jgi:hypothetical protein
MVWRKKDKKPILARFVGFAMQYLAWGNRIRGRFLSKKA